MVLLLRSDFFFAKEGFDLNGSVVFWWWNDDMLKHLIIGESFKGKEELMQEYFCKICCGCAETNRETFRTAGIQNRAILNWTEIISNNLFLVDLRLYYTENKFLNCTHLTHMWTSRKKTRITHRILTLPDVTDKLSRARPSKFKKCNFNCN